MTAIRIAAATLFLAASTLAIAGPGTPQLPEPETLALIGIGAIALAIARRRRK